MGVVFHSTSSYLSSKCFWSMASTLHPSRRAWTLIVLHGVAHKVYLIVPENLELHNKIFVDRMGSKLGR